MKAAELWKELSIRHKAVLWLVTIIVVMAVLLYSSIAARGFAFSQLSRMQDNENKCYAVLEALKTESQAFEALFREESQANRQDFSDACAAAVSALDDLPGDYIEIGEERYARTWSLRSGYEGYCVYRDAVAAMDPDDPEYSAKFYQAVEMQADLSTYALRLVNATIQHSTDSYRRTLALYEALTPLTAVLTLVALLAVIGIFRLVQRSLVRPILQMSAQSRRIAENDFNMPDLTIDHEDEVGELLYAFNRMKHATRGHIQALEENNRMEAELHRQELERLELEQNLDRTRLEMLKSQVNPHFLFNTLNMISSMARLEDAQNTDRMILSLSGIFRYNLRTKEQEVTLEQELDVLDDYIHIQQTRFDGRISYNKQIRVDPRQVCIPSFTLQPIVENAFVHGLARREEGGRIFLRIWQEGRMLRISIADNGCGMDAERLEALRQRIRTSSETGRGIGLGNISRRISMLYPQGSLRIYSSVNRGTVIQCTIPQKKEGA